MNSHRRNLSVDTKGSSRCEGRVESDVLYLLEQQLVLLAKGVDLRGVQIVGFDHFELLDANVLNLLVEL